MLQVQSIHTIQLATSGQPALFAEVVADDVDWTQMGAHPLAHRYRSKHAYFEVLAAAESMSCVPLLLSTAVEPQLPADCCTGRPRRTDAQAPDGPIARIKKAIRGSLRLHVQSVLISGTWATVELHAEAIAKAGWAFDNQYCWLLEFQPNGLVQTVRSYIADSAAVARLIEESEA